ncbi:transglutaminase family protein [Nakamurella flava]|uniref:Transglutaminase family protein n=1 Tax=Nakamurella flava TaxID=2576308 RepID=A0A4U6QJC1_9ACTN|nr:transglutaminase family protein [Nakamurella flava]
MTTGGAVVPDDAVVTTRRYRIEHRTEYRYSDEVSSSYGRVSLRPRDFPGQQCQDHQLTVDPVPDDESDGSDVYGNHTGYYQISHPHRVLSVVGVSRVQVQRPVVDEVAAGQPWESARPAGPLGARAMEFALPSTRIQLGPDVAAYAARSLQPGRPLLDAVLDLTHRIHADFRYDSEATTVSSTIADVLNTRAGVCQDFAHLAVAALRTQGLACRYVSGYLATDPPPGRERMVGADASHAWAAVRLPDGEWVGFDPTNDQLADERYTVLAWGRDYEDVAPLRGIIFTDAESSEMSVSVDVAPLD